MKAAINLSIRPSIIHTHDVIVVFIVNGLPPIEVIIGCISGRAISGHLVTRD